MSKKKDKAARRKKAEEAGLFELQAHHYRAIELRYQGKTYKEIMGELAVEFRKGYHYKTIAEWFGRDGLLIEHYFEYARQENDQRRQMMREELKKLVGKVPEKIQKLLDRTDDSDQPDMVVVQTLKLLVDILGISGNDDPAGNGSKLGEYFKRLEEAKLPESGHERPT